MFRSTMTTNFADVSGIRRLVVPRAIPRDGYLRGGHALDPTEFPTLEHYASRRDIMRPYVCLGEGLKFSDGIEGSATVLDV